MPAAAVCREDQAVYVRYSLPQQPAQLHPLLQGHAILGIAHVHKPRHSNQRHSNKL